MLKKRLVFTLVLAALSLVAPAHSATSTKSSSKKKSHPAPPVVKSVAPDECPHTTAMLLAQLSGDGQQSVRFKASARGRYFFFEEPAGVTVYLYSGGDEYRKQAFLAGSTIEKAEKNYDLTGTVVKPK